MANILDALFTAGDVPGGVFAYKAIPLEVNVPLKAAFKNTYVDYYKANKFWGKVLDHTVPLHQYREVIPTGQVFEGESRWFLQGTPFPIHPLWRAMLGIPSEDQVYLANPFH